MDSGFSALRIGTIGRFQEERNHKSEAGGLFSKSFLFLSSIKSARLRKGTQADHSVCAPHFPV